MMRKKRSNLGDRTSASPAIRKATNRTPNLTPHRRLAYAAAKNEMEDADASTRALPLRERAVGSKPLLFSSSRPF